MAKSAKKAKKGHRHKLRNAMRPVRTASSRPSGAGPMDRPQKTLTRGRTLLYGAGGAAIAAVACALVAREDILPLQLANGLVAAVGGTAAVIAESPIAQAIGQGAALAAGAQLGLSYIDHHYQENPPKLPTVVAAKGTAKGDGKRQAESLPPGALEAAYERARRRMSMAEAASQMAA